MSIATAKILLIDKDEECLKNHTEIIRDELRGYIEVLSASSQEESLNVLFSNRKIECIVMRVTSTINGDWFEYIKSIRNISKTPIIVLSPEPTSKLRWFAKVAGITAVIRHNKEDSHNELTQAIVDSISRIRERKDQLCELEKQISDVHEIVLESSKTQEEMKELMELRGVRIDNIETKLSQVENNVKDRNIFCKKRVKYENILGFSLLSAIMFAIITGCILGIIKYAFSDTHSTNAIIAPFE